MSLLFTESWDGIGTTGSDYIGKWAAASGSTGAGRNGNAAISGTWRYDLETADKDDRLICGFAYKRPVARGTRTFFLFSSDSAGTNHTTIRSRDDGSFEIWTGVAGAGGVLLGASAADVYQAATWHYIEIDATLHDTLGAVTLRVDGTAVITLTNVDTKGGGTETVFGSFTLASTASEENFDDCVLMNAVDSGIVGLPNNAFLGDVIVEALFPNGNGNYSQFDGSDADSVDNYLLVDETGAPDDDTTYVESLIDDEKDSYNFAPTTGTGNVAGVAVYARARRTDTDSRDIALLAREGGTDAQSADQVLASGYGWHRHVFEAEPDGTVWTLAEVDGAEFGVVSRPT